ncbi:MAG: hypothetical protein WEB50_02680 [Vicinamibacterales bacterium]
MATSRDERYRRDPTADRFEAILERTLTRYHRDELHGGAHRVAERILDETLVPIAREAFLDADDLPSDADVLRTLDEPLRLLGEGYHVLALVEPRERFVVKYAKHLDPVPPLAGAPPHAKPQWERDHGVRPDGSLHPAIWQHIRAFEAYGLLVVPSRVYLAETAVDALSAGERRRIERFRSMGIVRSLGAEPRPLRVGELQALKEILHALGFIDPLDRWCARDGTLVFTGDIGHGRHLQEVFDFIHHLAGQAHRLGGHIVWTLGNHDLYVDREGGQGGEDSLGYRLWPDIREAALHPERHPGLTVQAAYFEHEKLFVHAGLLPNIVALALRERGAGDAETVASYVNDVLRDTLVERERISARDLPHEIFHIGTSHTLERRMPGEIGYEPAGVFTPDLREVDHYRYHAQLLPQVVGHTASRRGEIRYAPGSWTRRDYIAIDVGRQHGTGNGALLLTDFGWVSVAPGGPARLVEVSPLFVELAREASEGWQDEQGEARLGSMLSAYFQMTRQEPPAPGEVEEALFSDLSPAQVVSLERFLATVRQTGRSVILTDLDEMLSAFSGCAPEQGAVQALAKYLAAGGVVVFSTETAFDWFYVRLLRPLVLELGARSPALAGALLLLAGGADIFAFEDGAFRLMSREAGRDRLAGFDALVALSQVRLPDGMPALDPAHTAYIADSTVHGRIDWPIAGRAGVVVDVGDAMAGAGKEPLANLHHGYRRTVDVLLTATAALQDSGRATLPPALPEVGEPLLWTFDRRQFPPGRRLRVRVAGSGFVHAGVAGAKGAWDPIYKVPLVPLGEGGYEAVLPSGVTEFTFFWTEAPWTPGRPGHWERGPRGVRSFKGRIDAQEKKG